MSERKPITLTITGVFDPDDLHLLSAAIRVIDGRHRDAHYEMFIDDPESTLAEAEQLVRGMLPGHDITVHRKQ